MMERSEQVSPEPSDEERAAGGWVGPLLLAVSPFLLFLLLFLADQLFR